MSSDSKYGGDAMTKLDEAVERLVEQSVKDFLDDIWGDPACGDTFWKSPEDRNSGKDLVALRQIGIYVTATLRDFASEVVAATKPQGGEVEVLKKNLQGSAATIRDQMDEVTALTARCKRLEDALRQMGDCDLDSLEVFMEEDEQVNRLWDAVVNAREVLRAQAALEDKEVGG